jgi:hypothetical protein
MHSSVSLTPKTWEVWKTITLRADTETTKALYEKRITSGFKVSNWIKPFIDNHSQVIYHDKSDVDLVMVSLTDFGFVNAVTYEKMYKKASELGLKLCTIEIMLELRHQYTDQPPKTRFLIASELWQDNGDSFATFHLMRSGDESSLEVFFIRRNASFCQPGDYFIFVKA